MNVGLSEDDPSTGKIVRRYMQSLPLYPFEILSIAGDVIHSLRSSPDHLAYQLAVVGSGTTPGRQVEFPIAKDRKTYEADKVRKVRGIRPEAVQAIDRLRPYRGGNDTLWRLHELDNIDKHRCLFVVEKDALFVAPWYEHPRPFLIRPRTVNADGLQFSGAFQSDVENDVDLEIKKADDENEESQRAALLPTLQRMIDVVQDVVYSFEAFL